MPFLDVIFKRIFTSYTAQNDEYLDGIFILVDRIKREYRVVILLAVKFCRMQGLKQLRVEERHKGGN